MPRFIVILNTTVGHRTKETSVVIECDGTTDSLVERADELARLDSSGRTVWKEIRPLQGSD